MIEYIYIPIILLLYTKTWKYCQLIDDFVPRGGYLLDLGERQNHFSFYDKQRPPMATITNIGVFIATCFAIHHIWGWKAALLFSVFPLNVSGVAWSTGNYYMTTALLVLTSYFFAIKGTAETIISIPFYIAALGSTVSAIPFTFVIPMITGLKYHLIFIIPLLFFLFGHRFTTGLKLRKDRHKIIYVEAGKFNPKVIFLMVQIMAYYIVLSLWPSRLGMWHQFPKEESRLNLLNNPSRLFFSSLALLILWAIWGWQANPSMIIWWLFFMGIFSQFVTFGMMIAERYTYIPNVAFCVLISQFFPIEILIVISSIWFCKSWQYIKCYKHNKDLFMESADAQPHAIENYTNLACYYLEHQRSHKAIEPLLRANQICEGKNSGIHDNLAKCYYRNGYFSKAKDHTEKALINCPQTRREHLLKFLNIVNEKIDKLQSNRTLLKEKGII